MSMFVKPAMVYVGTCSEARPPSLLVRVVTYKHGAMRVVQHVVGAAAEDGASDRAHTT